MKDISATEAARNFSELLDAVEHRNESFLVVRKGKPVARLVGAAGASGVVLKKILKRHSRDRAWANELVELRSLLEPEDRRWNG
jgi:prevent-host-death family protein